MLTTGEPMKPVFEYLDYRHFLRDYYLEKKALSKFSFREFSKAAGFASPVFIKLVIEGKSDLSKPSSIKLCKAMGLEKKEKNFFEDLVHFNQAKNIGDKMRFLERLKRSTTNAVPAVLTDEQFEYFSRWYHPVVRELLNLTEFNGNVEALSAMIIPAIKTPALVKSIALLKRIGLIEEDSRGKLRATKQFVSSSGIEMQTLAVKNVQREMALLAGDAISTVPAEERDISGVSIGISPEGFLKARDELARCRQRLLEIAAEDEKSDQVYRINLHLFPLSSRIPAGQLKKSETKYAE